MTSALEFESFAARWWQDVPELVAARIYAPATRARGVSAWVLYVELVETVYAARHVDLAERKLAWWLDALDAADRGHAEHPVLRAWLAAPAMTPARLVDSGRAALQALEQPTPANAAVLLDQARTLAAPVAAWWPADRDTIEVLALLAILVRLRFMERAQGAGAFVLPLDRLARAGLAPPRDARDWSAYHLLAAELALALRARALDLRPALAEHAALARLLATAFGHVARTRDAAILIRPGLWATVAAWRAALRAGG